MPSGIIIAIVVVLLLVIGGFIFYKMRKSSAKGTAAAAIVKEDKAMEAVGEFQAAVENEVIEQQNAIEAFVLNRLRSASGVDQLLRHIKILELCPLPPVRERRGHHRGAP